MSRGSSLNYSENGRALLRPEEVLSMNDDHLIAFQRGMSPILAERVKWYQDPDFNPAVARKRKQPWRWENLSWDWKLFVAGVVCLILLALVNRVNN
jgi:type IV secretory pathway TraG/TraD family ATPase VirD4